jgi:hypothetical protein
MIFDIIFPVLHAKSQTIFAIAPALLALIPSLIQMGQGIAQGARAKKIASGNQRPTYTATPYKVPDEIAQYVARTKAQVNTRLPGQSLMENKIDANSSNAIAAIQQSGNSPADIINSISGINGQQNDAYNNLGIAGVQRNDQNQANVNSALLTAAKYKDNAYNINSGNRQAEFEYNKNQPYQANAAAASALTGAGQQNLYNGIQGASNIGTILAADAEKNKNPDTVIRNMAPPQIPMIQPGSIPNPGANQQPQIQTTLPDQQGIPEGMSPWIYAKLKKQGLIK